MNTATNNLENDHIYITRLMDVMDKMSETRSSSITDFEKVVILIKNYADGLHHAKEENLLFPMMISKGYSKEHGPVAVMLQEHVTGREFVEGMAQAITLLKAGDEKGIDAVYKNFTGYTMLLRNHIGKENNILFRMADNVLTEADHNELLSKFAIVEESRICGAVINEYIKDIESLEVAYL